MRRGSRRVVQQLDALNQTRRTLLLQRIAEYKYRHVVVIVDFVVGMELPAFAETAVVRIWPGNDQVIGHIVAEAASSTSHRLASCTVCCPAYLFNITIPTSEEADEKLRAIRLRKDRGISISC
jgi:hypothetical protein